MERFGRWRGLFDSQFDIRIGLNILKISLLLLQNYRNCILSFHIQDSICYVGYNNQIIITCNVVMPMVSGSWPHINTTLVSHQSRWATEMAISKFSFGHYEYTNQMAVNVQMFYRYLTLSMDGYRSHSSCLLFIPCVSIADRYSKTLALYISWLGTCYEYRLRSINELHRPAVWNNVP